MNQLRFSELARTVLRFDQSIDQLVSVAEALGIPSPKNRSWYELLKQKLLPQLAHRPFLVVAVSGGTNTGKSVVFNHFAGENASAADYRAAGTKHPLCLLSPVSGDEISESMESVLQRHFEGFAILPWRTPADPLQKADEHRLFWRTGANVPERLILLDTPDIDSDAEVNWERARTVRQVADLLIAVLTSQKYNDAAIKRFFREAGQASKPVILLFNMFDEATDAGSLPRWIEQFREETGVNPLAVYVVPHDPKAAAAISLPFFQVQAGVTPKTVRIVPEPVSLQKTLCELHFDEIKTQTLLGAVAVLDDPRSGVRTYLDEIRQTASLFADAKTALHCSEQAEIDWPGLPGQLLVEEIRDWWNERRPGWSKNVHGTYRKIGNGILWPIRWAWKTIAGTGKTVDPISEFKQNEYETVMIVVEKTISRLEKMALTTNPVLKSELEILLSGEHRRKLIEQAKAAHAAMKPIGDDFRVYLREMLDDWSEENPGTHNTIRWLDHAAAIARPVVTLSLAIGGFTFAGDILGQTGTLLVTHVVSEAAITGGITGGGEAVVHQTGEGIKKGMARLFNNIQQEYARNRAKLFFEWFQRELWSDLLLRLGKGERIAESPEFLETLDCIGKLYPNTPIN